MKFVCAVLLITCACAKAVEIQGGEGVYEPIQWKLPAQKLYTKVVGDQNTADDELLASEIALLDNSQRNLVANHIKNLLEGFRDVIINGNENRPPLDPFYAEKIGPLGYSSNGIRVSGNIKNLHGDGLRWYIVDEVTFNALRLTLGVHLTLPWLRANGGYDANARILLLNHNAGGNLRVFVNRVEVGVDIRVGTNLLAGHLILRELDIKIDIHDTLIQIDGMTGSVTLNNVISGWVQNISQDLIQNQLHNVSQKLSEDLFDTINDVLKDYTLADILG